MTKIIEAKAVISAEDKTGKVFDSIAKKINGVAKAATAFQGIKPPQGGAGGLLSLGQKGWGAQFQKDIDAMHLSSRQLAKVQQNWEGFHSAMSKGPVRFANYVRAIDDWKKSTLSGLKEVQVGMEEHERRRKRFFGAMSGGMMRAGGGLRMGGEIALAAGGVGGAVYMGAAAIRAGAKAASDRAREMARYSLGGLTDQEKQEANAKADEISSKYPSVGRTDVLAHIRQLRARLGDFHHAIDNAETLSKAQVVLGTLGHGEGSAEDLEKLVLGLESQGIGNNPEKFKAYLNAFVKAKSLFPDLRGEDFRQYMKNSNASKYGLSDDYLQNVVPTMMQHEGANNFGTMQASAFSALVGGRQTKSAKAVMASYGLTSDKEGNKVRDLDKLVSNPYKWATENLAPALEKKGISMDEEHRGDVVKAVTQMFSNRKVGEYFTSMLVNQGIIAKDRELLKGAKGTEGAETARSQDPYVALSGLTNQMKDFAAAVIGMKPVIDTMNDLSSEISNRTKAAREGRYFDLLTTEDDRRIINGWNTPLSEINERNRRGNLELQQREVDEKLRQGGYSDALTKQFRMRAFELRSGIEASKNASGMPPIFSDAERERWEEMDREHRRGVALSGMRGGGWSSPGIPLPTSDPRKTFSEMPPVQTLEGANVQATLTGSAEVRGEMTGKFEVTASSTLLQIVESLKTFKASLSGSYNANGPGSLGHSSPDAAAPPDNGASGAW